MKLITASLFFSLSFLVGFGQELVQAGTQPEASLMGTWVAKRVESRAGELVMSDADVVESDLIFIFDRTRLTLYTQGRKTTVNYTRDGQSIITNRASAYQIEKLTPFELILNENTAGVSSSGRLRIYLARFEGNYEQYMFQKYVVPNLRFDGDTFYVMNDYVYPKFTGRLGGDTFFDSYENSYQFIEDVFRQQGRPKRDRFRVSFMVNRQGHVEDIRIIESTDTLYNRALRQAVRSTDFRWTPATANARPARVQVNYEFPYGLPEDRQLTFSEINQLKSKDLAVDGLRNFQRKRYDQALVTFNQALVLDPANVSIRLNRAATYYQLNQTPRACADWGYLQSTGNKQAARLLKKYCQ